MRFNNRTLENIVRWKTKPTHSGIAYMQCGPLTPCVQGGEAAVTKSPEIFSQVSIVIKECTCGERGATSFCTHESIPAWRQCGVSAVNRTSGCLRVKHARDLEACLSCPKAAQYLLASSAGIGFRDLPKLLLSQEVQPLLTPSPGIGGCPLL